MDEEREKIQKLNTLLKLKQQELEKQFKEVEEQKNDINNKVETLLKERVDSILNENQKLKTAVQKLLEERQLLEAERAKALAEQKKRSELQSQLQLLQKQVASYASQNQSTTTTLDNSKIQEERRMIEEERKKLEEDKKKFEEDKKRLEDDKTKLTDEKNKYQQDKLKLDEIIEKLRKKKKSDGGRVLSMSPVIGTHTKTPSTPRSTLASVSESKPLQSVSSPTVPKIPTNLVQPGLQSLSLSNIPSELSDLEDDEEVDDNMKTPTSRKSMMSASTGKKKRVRNPMRRTMSNTGSPTTVEIPGTRQPTSLSRPTSMNLSARRSFSHIRPKSTTDGQLGDFAALQKEIARLDAIKAASQATPSKNNNKTTTSTTAPTSQPSTQTPTSPIKNATPSPSPSGNTLKSSSSSNSVPSTGMVQSTSGGSINTKIDKASSSSGGSATSPSTPVAPTPVPAPLLAIPTSFKLPPPRPNFDISKEKLPFLPEKLFEYSGIITQLNVSQNKLTELPEDIGKFLKLTELDVSSNHLKSLPSSFFNPNNSCCNTLKSLLLGGNLGIKIPSNITNFCNLSTLSLSRNGFSTVPKVIYSLNHLLHIDISFNKLKKISKKISGLSKLCTLIAHSNMIAEVPNEIGKCLDITYLDLKNNKISSLPTTIGNLKKLEELLLSNNNISNLPADFKLNNFPSLFKIDLFKNNLTKIPDTFLDGAENSVLEEIHLGRNKISTIPEKFWECQLISLEMKYNNIETISSSIGNLFKLAILDLSFNKIKIIPPELGQCAELITLNLAGNLIEELPDELRYVNRLKHLYLSYNRLKEIAFFEDTYYEELEELFLSGNFYFNKIPPQIITDNGPIIRSLFLNNLNLEEIPSEISSLRYLEQLDLSHNKIRTLPSQITQLRVLYSLDLSHNQLVNTPLVESLGEEYQDEEDGGDGDENQSSMTWDNVDWSYDLTSIEIIDFGYNKLERLPNGIDLLIERGIQVHYIGNPCAGDEYASIDKNYGKLWVTNPSVSNDSGKTATGGSGGLKSSRSAGNVPSNSSSSSSSFPQSISIGWSELVGRRTNQEDALCIAGVIGNVPTQSSGGQSSTTSSSSTPVHLFALFDGHAGRGAADFAAENFTETFLQKFQQDLKNPLKSLMDSFYSINDKFKEYTLTCKDPSIRQSGATAVAALVIGRDIYVANVGDARAVLYKGSSSGSSSSSSAAVPINNKDCRHFDSIVDSSSQVLRLSEEHRPDDEEERIRKDGGYVIDSRVNGYLGVSRSIGDFYIDPVICKPSGNKYTIPSNSNDVFLVMGCDGVWDEISDSEACSSILMNHKEHKNVHQLSSILRDEAYLLGSDDNISVVLIKLN
eukprot:TRINITY_DN4152_c0_g2_i1.p1 TRINITY_DN4152_c0_g2~~TRINITY_DN4152_c0_g2_i1.p1  ORF type:complete len:1344 (+),score=390.58 TRINITY_DN4152_c0_g2_i1:2-4033(+)